MTITKIRPRGMLWIFVLLLLSACQSDPITVTEHLPEPGVALAKKIVFLAGPDSHEPGAHEHLAGSSLLAAALRAQHPDYATVVVYGGWPEDDGVFSDVSALVLYCDGGSGHIISNHLPAFDQMLAEGVGVVALHYGVEVPVGSAAARSMLGAIGGYFETHWSVNPHWEANYLSLPKHAISKGVRPFKQLDEWYFNMRFVAPAIGVTPILAAVAPAHTMDRWNGAHSGNEAVRKLVAGGVPQVTAWAYERPGGGRGFGYTGGHFHENWQHEDARGLVLNAITWVADGT